MENSPVEQQLEPYTESPECPKCGCDSVSTRFDKGMKPDALRRLCCGCGFIWHTRCKDYEEESAYAQDVPVKDRWVRLKEAHPGALYVRVVPVDDPGTKTYRAYYDTYDGERIAISED